MPPPCSESLIDVEFLTSSAGGDPALDVALPHALLDRVAHGHRRPVLRCYRPRATVAFGRRDTFLSGFPTAVAAARRHGFTPVIRGAGGRAAAYDEGSLIFDEVMPSDGSQIRQRFADDARRQARALQRLGVDARVGEVPGEYCPGEFSINARGRVKLVGAAERIVRGAWLHSSVIVVEGASRLRAVLEDVYAALGLEWDPDTTGAVADEAPRARFDDVRDAVLAEYEARYALTPAPITADDLASAAGLLDRHRVDQRG
jgi:lipoate-protein ligase A